MTKSTSGKVHINVDVSKDVAEYIRSQPHQGRYIEELVRRDKGAEETQSQRLQQLESEVHQNHIKIDGLEFRMFGQSYTSTGESILSFSFNLKDQILETLEMQTLADGKTMRSFAFRNWQGHYVGRALLGTDPGWSGGFKLEIETISRIGEKLYDANQMPDELQRTTYGWDIVGKLNRLEMLAFRLFRDLVPAEKLDATFRELGIDKQRLEQFTTF